MKNREPIKRSSGERHFSSPITDEDIEWEEIIHAFQDTELPEWPKEFWYDNWIPFNAISPLFLKMKMTKKSGLFPGIMEYC